MSILRVESKEGEEKSWDKSINMDFVIFKCEVCGNEVRRRKKEFRKNSKLVCGSCLRKRTRNEKYGNYNNYEKIKQTNLEKYGVENIMQLEEFRERAKQTRIEKYGDENFNNRELAKKTSLEIYGTEHPFQLERFKNKYKETCIKKYGVENVLSLENIRDKIKQTNLEKYGSYNNYEKIKQTNLEKYGVENVFSNEEIQNKKINSRIKSGYINLKLHSYWDINHLFDVENYKGTYSSSNYYFECKICGTIFKDHLFAGRKPRCPTCFPKNRSKGEAELADFLKQYIEIIENDRELIKPKEIDILIPSLNLAIEYNGEFWHTDVERELIKKELVESKGYDLIVIWESNWNERKEEIKEDLLRVIKNEE